MWDTMRRCLNMHCVYLRQSRILTSEFYEPLYCTLPFRVEGNYCAPTMCQELGWHLVTTNFTYFFTRTLNGIIILFLQLERWKISKLHNLLEVTLTLRIQTWIWLILRPMRSKKKSSVVVVLLCDQMNNEWVLGILQIRTTALTTFYTHRSHLS